MGNDWLHKLDEQFRTPLDRAIHSNHMALTELLLRQEAEDRHPSLDGSTILHKATSLGLYEAVQSLLKEGMDPNLVDKYGETALHTAARHGHANVVELLLQHGASPNAVNVFGLSPLHWVALNGGTETAELLLNAGADANLMNGYLDGLTPILLARIMGYDEAADVMESHTR